MIEREIKLRVADRAKLVAAVRKSGFRVVHRRVFEANVVMDTPEASLRASGRLLRLRQAGRDYTLTFKGVQQRSGRHKQREEIESKVSDFDRTQLIFERIGLEVKFRYEKYRTEYQRAGDTGILMIDDTPIGCFMELEGPAYWIDRVAAELGYKRAEYVLDSYGALYFQYCDAHGLKGTHMTFPRLDKRGNTTLGKTTLER